MSEPYSGFDDDGWSAPVKILLRKPLFRGTTLLIGTLHWTLNDHPDQNVFIFSQFLNVYFKPGQCLIHSKWGANGFFTAYVVDGSQFSFLQGEPFHLIPIFETCYLFVTSIKLFCWKKTLYFKGTQAQFINFYL
jgi:hypothetical protein